MTKREMPARDFTTEELTVIYRFLKSKKYNIQKQYIKKLFQPDFFINDGLAKIFTCKIAGRGKHGHYNEILEYRLADILYTLNVAYWFGNDAPKKGKLGKHIVFDYEEAITKLKEHTGIDLNV